MQAQSFTTHIEVTKTPQDVFRSITRDVSKWWGGKDLTGSSTNVNDVFIIHHPGAHYSRQNVVECVPDQKVVWLVTESTLFWLQKDQQEWTNTRMIFEISRKGDKTVLHFTHKGLVPEKECYDKCYQGWSMVITDWLFRYIEQDTAHF